MGLGDWGGVEKVNGENGTYVVLLTIKIKKNKAVISFFCNDGNSLLPLLSYDLLKMEMYVLMLFFYISQP